jgi:hypothetical protein
MRREKKRKEKKKETEEGGWRTEDLMEETRTRA